MYGITVYLQKTCILKSARAFLVFKSVENKGELIKSVPSTEQIEDEEFDFDEAAKNVLFRISKNLL